MNRTNGIIHSKKQTTMKLTSLHLDISESVLDNAGKWLRAKIQTWGNKPGNEYLHSLLSQASKVEGSILQDSAASKVWWDALLDHYSIPTDRRKECILHVTNIVQEKISDLLSQDPESYIRRGHKRHTFHRPKVDWYHLLAQLVDDHRRMREDTWSDKHRTDAVYKLAAALAIKEVRKFAKRIADEVRQTQTQQTSTPEPDQSPEGLEAQRIADRLWQWSNYYATSKNAKLNKPKVQANIDRLKELGYMVQWRGNKTKEWPNGDERPIVVRKHS